MDDRHKQALGALAMMVRQHLEELEESVFDSAAQSAGEHAISALAEYGYMEEVGRGRIIGRWTEAGKALLEWAYPAADQKKKSFPPPSISAPAPEKL